MIWINFKCNSCWSIHYRSARIIDGSTIEVVCNCGCVEHLHVGG
jgi:hypothetical protein